MDISVGKKHICTQLEECQGEGGSDEFAQGEKLKKTLCLTKSEMSGSYYTLKNTAEEGEQDKKKLHENFMCYCENNVGELEGNISLAKTKPENQALSFCTT